MGLLIKNGEIVTGDSHYVADIWCENETVTRIDRKIDPPAGAEVIDASGKYVFPGFIDPHTHIYLPFMGTFSKDNYETGTKAALVGGTTGRPRTRFGEASSSLTRERLGSTMRSYFRLSGSRGNLAW